MDSEDTPLSNERSSAFETAAELLAAPGALMPLSVEEARVVVGYMTPRFIPANTTFILEGDAADDGFMALLLEGEVVVESITVSRTEPLTICVLGPALPSRPLSMKNPALAPSCCWPFRRVWPSACVTTPASCGSMPSWPRRCSWRLTGHSCGGHSFSEKCL